MPYLLRYMLQGMPVVASAATPKMALAMARAFASAHRNVTITDELGPAMQAPPVTAGLHPALAGLLASLPASQQGWTQDARDRWYAAFGVVLDFAVPVGPAVAAADPEEPPEEAV